MDMLQVIHRSCPTQIEGIFSGAFVTGTLTLNLVQTGEGMVHLCALPKHLAALGRLACLTSLDAQRFLSMYTARAPAG
jgi:hypothetical protein